MIALMTTVFVASLVGSLHCAGMCGGIVTLCVSGKPMARRRDWSPHALYNLGRGITYTTLGAVSGALGAAVNVGGSAMGWSRAAMYVAGGMMIIVGVVALLRTTGMKLGCMPMPAALQKLFGSAVAAGRRLPLGVQPFVIGLLTGLLPCGWLYAFVISAAGTGSPWLGALVMATFWAGTLPIMFALGVGAQKITGPLRKHIPRLTAAALVVVGVITIVGRLHVPAYADSPVLQQPTESCVIEHIESLDAGEMPCCHDKS